MSELTIHDLQKWKDEIVNEGKHLNEKTPSHKKYKRKDSYGFEVPMELSFDEYWSSQERIEKLSTEESYRQRDERLKRLNTPTDTDSTKKGGSE